MYVLWASVVSFVCGSLYVVSKDLFCCWTTEYVPYFLKLFVDAALLQLDAATLRAMRPKRRVLLVRFLAKALLCPYYRYVTPHTSCLYPCTVLYITQDTAVDTTFKVQIRSTKIVDNNRPAACRPEYVEAQSEGLVLAALEGKVINPALLAQLQQQQQQQGAGRARGKVAAEALQQLLSKDQVPAVVEALVLKYVALTSDELEEWSSDPEGYIR